MYGNPYYDPYPGYDYLEHYGVKGMRWGKNKQGRVRDRYPGQNVPKRTRQIRLSDGTSATMTTMRYGWNVVTENGDYIYDKDGDTRIKESDVKQANADVSRAKLAAAKVEKNTNPTRRGMNVIQRTIKTRGNTKASSLKNSSMRVKTGQEKVTQTLNKLKSTLPKKKTKFK